MNCFDYFLMIEQKIVYFKTIISRDSLFFTKYGWKMIVDSKFLVNKINN